MLSPSSHLSYLPQSQLPHGHRPHAVTAVPYLTAVAAYQQLTCTAVRRGAYTDTRQRAVLACRACDLRAGGIPYDRSHFYYCCNTERTIASYGKSRAGRIAGRPPRLSTMSSYSPCAIMVNGTAACHALSSDITMSQRAPVRAPLRGTSCSETTL